jgi:CspA family cold shock protein
MQKGTIARLMDKGFGFIAIEGQDKDLFFHMNELQNANFDDLREGDMLEFEVVDGEKGKNAVNVSKINA